ncbi:MAG: tetratricopeptide repeat protein [Kiloniellales bacterium]
MTPPSDPIRSGDTQPAISRPGRLAFALALALGAAGCATTDVVEETKSAPPLLVSSETLATAERAIDQGRYDDARLVLERVLLAEPDNARAQLALAEIHLAHNGLEAAIRGFEALTDRAEVAGRAHQGIGIALLLQSRDDEAVKTLEQAVALDPNLWRAWNALGSYHDRNRAWADAGRSYDKALAVKPDSAILYNNRGFSNLLQHRFDSAISDFTVALRFDPDLTPARENLRLALAWTGQYQQALFGVPQAEIGGAFNNIGFVALLRGDFDAAESYLLRSMEADPTFNRVANKNLEYLKNLRLIKAAAVAGET